MSNRDLLSHLHADVATQLVAPDEQTPDWYAFQHPLLVDAFLTLLTPAERGRLNGQAADAVEAVYPGLPGEWCQVSATLRLRAGDLARAGRLLAEAGQRALAQGAAVSAVTLLDQALELLPGTGDTQARADAFAALLSALVEAGMVERAVAAAREFEHITSLLSRRPPGAPAHQARLGRRGRGPIPRRPGPCRRRPAAARAGCPDHDTAPVDVVAAHLALDLPGPDQVRMAEVLARRAADVAEAAQLPVVACQAWQLLGALSRSRDPDQATACLEKARQLAVRYELPIEEIHALIRLGNDDALRDGSLDRLEHVRREASRVGAVTARYQAEASLALQAILRGDFAAAATLLDQVLESTTRLRLLETTRYALLLRAVLGAHQGRRREMEAALVDLRRWEGDEAQHTPRVHGLARAWCALLEENRSRALHELSLALAAEENSPTTFQLTGRYGLHLLLRVLEGTADRVEYQVITAAPVSRLRWDRQFALFASAVLSGRAGRGAEACAALAEAMQVAGPYATGRHLGLRLVSEAAVIDGWGTPVEWLRAAEEYFHAREVPAVASACRALMRRAGDSGHPAPPRCPGHPLAAARRRDHRSRVRDLASAHRSSQQIREIARTTASIASHRGETCGQPHHQDRPAQPDRAGPVRGRHAVNYPDSLHCGPTDRQAASQDTSRARSSRQRQIRATQARATASAARAAPAATISRSRAWAAVSGGMRTFPAWSSHTGTVLPALVPEIAGILPARRLPAAVQWAGTQTIHELVPFADIIGPATAASTTPGTGAKDRWACRVAALSACPSQTAMLATSGPRARNTMTAAGRSHAAIRSERRRSGLWSLPNRRVSLVHVIVGVVIRSLQGRIRPLRCDRIP